MNAPAIIKRDLEPQVSAAWRAVDTLSNSAPEELAPHYLSLLEIRDKIDAAIASGKDKS